MLLSETLSSNADLVPSVSKFPRKANWNGKCVVYDTFPLINPYGSILNIAKHV